MNIEERLRWLIEHGVRPGASRAGDWWNGLEPHDRALLIGIGIGLLILPLALLQLSS